jgi:hypothetical protein
MIEVRAKPAGKGQFDYSVSGHAVQGRSHQPLLDACRQLKRMGADPAALVAVFHGEATDQWAIRTTVGKGAQLAVADLPRGGGPKFVRYRPFH